MGSKIIVVFLILAIAVSPTSTLGRSSPTIAPNDLSEQALASRTSFFFKSPLGRVTALMMVTALASWLMHDPSVFMAMAVVPPLTLKSPLIAEDTYDRWLSEVDLTLKGTSISATGRKILLGKLSPKTSYYGKGRWPIQVTDEANFYNLRDIPLRDRLILELRTLELDAYDRDREYDLLSHIREIKKDPFLFDCALRIYSLRLKKAFVSDVYSGPEVYYRFLRLALSLNYDIATGTLERFDERQYIAIPIGKTTSIESIVQRILPRGEDEPSFAMLDCGTGLGIFPLVVQRIIAEAAPHLQNTLFAGTEIASELDDWPSGHLQKLKRLGVKVIYNQAQLQPDGSAYILLQSWLNKMPFKFRFISWIKPYLWKPIQTIHDDWTPLMDRVAHYLPEIIHEHGTILIAPSGGDPEMMYLMGILPLLKMIRSRGLAARIRMVRLAPDFKRMKTTASLEKNISNIAVLNPGECDTAFLKLLIEFGEHDDDADLYLNPKHTFLRTYQSMLRVVIGRSKGKRRALLQYALDLVSKPASTKQQASPLNHISA